MKLLLWVLVGLLAVNNGKAQINVVPAGSATTTPEDLITNVFLGEGVQVLSISYQGKPGQVGYFTNGSADIGLDRGIIMSTGEASAIVGPASDFASTNTGSTAADPDLDSIGSTIQPGASVNDAAIYTIQFIPIADTLRFRYVFGSEEYPEYTCTQYNDVFGFFISGPGINGAFTNNGKNIALVPDPSDPTGLTFTTDYVSITNVQNGNPTDASCQPSYPMYYNDNSSSLNFVYDGYTDVFTAQAIVQPCQVYTIKLAIADLGDNIYDTGVFLEAKSFGTGSIITELNTVSVDGTIVEGCSDAQLVFKTSYPAEADLPLNYQIFGTATTPDDYIITKDGSPFTAGSPLIIPQGDTSVTLNVSAIADNIAENGEFIAVSIQKDICTTDTVYIPIKDNILVQADLGQDLSFCSGSIGDTIQLDGTLNMTLPPPPSFTYTGTANDVISNDLPALQAPLFVSGVQPPYLQDGVIRSVCVKLKHKFDADLDIFLFAPNNAPILLSSDNGNNSRDMDMCFTPMGPPVTSLQDTLSALFPPNGSVPFANINTLYFKGQYAPEGPFSDFWAGGLQTPTNGKWRLVIYDDQGSPFGDPATGLLQEWSITFEPLFKLHYQWDTTADLSCLDCPDPVLTIPNQTTTYHLTVADTYGCTTEDSITVFIQDSLDAPNVSCLIVGKDSITFGWDPVIGATSYEISVDGGSWQDIGNVLSFTVNGLAINQTVHLEIRAVGSCPAKTGVADCTTLDCVQPNFTASATEASCHGESTGAIQISNITGPQAPYSVSLNGITSANGIFDSLAAGSYQVIITDAIGCNFPVDITVHEPAPLTATGLETQMVSCAGDATGAGAIEVSGGTAPYSFQLNGTTDSVLTQVAAGSYSYTVTDAHGCATAGSITITENAPITLETFPVDPTCFDATDGQITAFNVQGGSAPYTYQWSDPNGQTTDKAINLPAGTYSVTVSDQLGCTAVQQNIVLTAPAEIVADITTTNAVCGGAPGSAVITASGGAGNLSFNWSDIGPGPAQRNDLPAGNYLVTISDQNGCAKVVDFTIEAPSDMVLNMTNTNVDCNGDNSGTASVSVTGGSPPYAYQWNDPLAQTNKTAVNLPAGQYKVIVTDAQQCVQSDTITITEPDALSVDTSVQHISCFGAATGAITTQVTGGTPPYQYSYTLPDNSTVATPNLQDIPAGTYQLVVTDAHNCQVALDITIQQPAPVTLSFAQIDTICFGSNNGTAQVSVSGGTAPYQYAWDFANSTTPQIQGAPAGTYQVTVTDAKGCTYADQAIIPEYPEIQLSLTQTPALCHDDPSGNAVVQTITVNGQSRPLSDYSFVWNTTPAQTTPDAYQLTGGQTYQVIATDKLTGCTAGTDIQIGNPQALTASLVEVHGVSCRGSQDGTARVTATGGTPPYTYQWGISANNQTGDSASNLPKGDHRVVITDAHNCQTELIVTIDEPEAIVITPQVTDVNCAGESTGQINIQVTGGEAPYQYSWNIGQNQPDLSNLPAGHYTLTVSDHRGCSKTQDIDITEPGQPLLATADATPVTCHGDRNGTIAIRADGGTPPYRYKLNDGNFTSSANKVGLYPGDYNVIVQDHRGCLDTITGIAVQEPEPVLVDIGPNLIIDYGDSVQLSADVQNAVGSITYQWAVSSQDESISCNDCPTPWVMPRYQEYYYLTVVDENGCTAGDEVLINVNKYTRIFVPTGFSPNGDGHNDILTVLGEKGVIIESFSIFDRWGEKVFERTSFPINDTAAGWDGIFRGQPMPAGQYAWQLRAIMPDGRLVTLQGLSTLLR